MPLFAPDYYKEFKCTAGLCRHSCCIGWEIEVDDDTYKYYKSLKGEFAERICRSIKEEEGVRCFRLSEDERCPFLNEENLCDIILNLGENKLCQICADHPRFRNYFDSRTEIGLGLCCEAAARLILLNKDKTKVVKAEDGFSEKSEEEEKFFSFRERIFDILQDRSKTTEERVGEMLKISGAALPPYSLSKWKQVFLSLEILDEKWRKILSKIECAGINLEFSEELELAFEQLLVYFVYRHLSECVFDLRKEERIAFSALGYYIIRALCCVKATKNKKVTIEDMLEFARMYSSEIEYSEENTESLLTLLKKS